MDSKLIFSCVSLFFLSWGVQVFSQELDATSIMEGEALERMLEKDGGASAIVALAKGASADGMACLQKLMPCQSDLHSSSPPETCCDPVKEMVKEGDCVCKVFDNEEVLKTVNVTVEDARALAKNCGAKVDPSSCKKLGSPSASPKAQPSPSKSDSSSSEMSKSSSKNSSDSSNASGKMRGMDGVVWCSASVTTMVLSTLYICDFV